MRSSYKMLVITVIYCIVGISLLCYNSIRVKSFHESIKIRRQLTQKIGLPDLAITTAARYLRHYSLTDISTPFQDYPVSFDHFPAGFAFVPPNYANMPAIMRVTGHPVSKEE